MFAKCKIVIWSKSGKTRQLAKAVVDLLPKEPQQAEMIWSGESLVWIAEAWVDDIYKLKEQTMKLEWEDGERIGDIDIFIGEQKISRKEMTHDANK